MFVKDGALWGMGDDTQGALDDDAGDGDAGIRSSVGDSGTFTVDKGSVARDIIDVPGGDGENAQAATPE